MAFFAGLNPVCCLCTSLFSGRSVGVRRYSDCQSKMSGADGPERISEVLNVVFSQLCFPQNPNPSPQLCVPLAVTDVGRVLCIPIAGDISLSCGFWRGPPVASTDIRILEMGVIFGLLSALQESSWRWTQLWKPCLFHRLEIENWSGNGLKFRAVVSPVLLLFSINTFNC